MKIYTSYFANLKSIPSLIVPISIARFVPRWIGEIKRYYDVAPTKELLYEYKRTFDEQKYIEEYLKQLDKIGKDTILEKISSISDGRDSVLLCYETPDKFCHRHILAKYLGNVTEIKTLKHPVPYSIDKSF